VFDQTHTIKLLVQSSWRWTLSCSKQVEDSIIELNHYGKQRVFCWFFLHMYIMMKGSENV